MACIEALHLWPYAGRIHRLEKEMDVLEGIRENVVVVERFALL